MPETCRTWPPEALVTRKLLPLHMKKLWVFMTSTARLLLALDSLVGTIKLAHIPPSRRPALSLRTWLPFVLRTNREALPKDTLSGLPSLFLMFKLPVASLFLETQSIGVVIDLPQQPHLQPAQGAKKFDFPESVEMDSFTAFSSIIMVSRDKSCPDKETCTSTLFPRCPPDIGTGYGSYD